MGNDGKETRKNVPCRHCVFSSSRRAAACRSGCYSACWWWWSGGSGVECWGMAWCAVLCCGGGSCAYFCVTFQSISILCSQWRMTFVNVRHFRFPFQPRQPLLLLSLPARTCKSWLRLALKSLSRKSQPSTPTTSEHSPFLPLQVASASAGWETTNTWVWRIRCQIFLLFPSFFFFMKSIF